MQCIFEGHNSLTLVYVDKLTLTNYSRGHIAIAVLQVFNDIRLYIAILLSRQDLITNDSLCTNAFFTTTFSLISSRSLWCTTRSCWWCHANAAHWRRSHTYSIHRRRSATWCAHRWRRHSYTCRRWCHAHATWRRHRTNGTSLSATHGSILYSPIIYRNKAIRIATWWPKGIGTICRCWSRRTALLQLSHTIQ